MSSWKVGFDSKNGNLDGKISKSDTSIPMHIMSLRKNDNKRSSCSVKPKPKTKDKQVLPNKKEIDNFYEDAIDLMKEPAERWTDSRVHAFLAAGPVVLPQLTAVDEVTVRKNCGASYVCTFKNSNDEDCRASVSGSLLFLRYEDQMKQETTTLLKNM